MHYYRTMKEARSALAIDTGFDPFVSGGWGRCTIEKLAKAGYVVDRKKAEKQNSVARCKECGVEVAREWDGEKYVPLKHCREHRKWRMVCDNMHRWYMTDAEAEASGHRCPTCGEYAV